MKKTKKINYSLIIALLMLSGLVLANSVLKNETKPSQKPLSNTDRKAALDERKKWEASPEGIKFKQWEASSEGKKVHEGAAKLRSFIKDFSNMEGVVTSLSLPPGTRLGFGMMVKINGVDYILAFGLENSNEFKQLRSLKVNDKIIIRSHSVSKAPKYAYPIVAGDYIEQDGKIIYKRLPGKGGC